MEFFASYEISAKIFFFSRYRLEGEDMQGVEVEVRYPVFPKHSQL